jgi:hypothetical protein
MAEIEFRLPSAVPYAYVNVKGTPEELAQINFEMLAALYANSLSAFQKAEVEAAKLIVQGVTGEPASRLEGAIASLAEQPQQSESPSEDPAEEIKEQLGATELDNVNAPWTAPPKGAKPKPWETEKPSAKLDIDPDFF